MNELIKRRKRLTELEVQCYLMQIISAIKNLHYHRVIHRDLKLGNLFLSDKMEIKLGDFGLATKLEFNGERKRTICGTPNYIAPEILEGKDTGHSYEVDVWSLGVIAYTLLIGKPPFETNDVKATYKRIRMNEYSFPDSVTISPAARNLIKSILQTDPMKRPNIDEIIDHEFFKVNGSIPKLLPVSTLACPPSSSYVRQFTGGSVSQIGRSNSPPHLENTTPFTKNSLNINTKADNIGTTLQKTSQNPGSLKSVSSTGLKERKDYINTYRTGGQSGSVNTFAPPSNYISSSQQPPNPQISTQLKTSELNTNKIEEQVRCTSTVTTNMSGGNTQNYSSSSKPSSSTYLGTTNRAILDKYQSQCINQGPVTNQVRAKSEKMHTQPASSLLQTYGLSHQTIIPSTATMISHNLSGTNLQQTQTPSIQPDNTLNGPDIWVQKWVDYSTKYGLGYLLSNGQTGVFFNDSTKIILNKKKEQTYSFILVQSQLLYNSQFEYFERRQQDKQDVGIVYNISSYPDELQKKVTLLQHFRSYLEGDDKQVKQSVQKLPDVDEQEKCANTKIYVKKWLRTNHAIVFRLNKSVQVIFQDQTEILLSNELRIVTYVNKKHERITYPLNYAMESSTQEMSKRLRYAKDILSHMLTNNTNGNVASNLKLIPENTSNINPTTVTTNNPIPPKSTEIQEKTHLKTHSSTSTQQRENLRLTKNNNTSSTSHLANNQHHPPPVAYNNFTQNENINTLLGSKGGYSHSQHSQMKTSASAISGLGQTGLANGQSGTKKQSSVAEIGSSSSSLQTQNILKSNSNFNKINYGNAPMTNSLSNLNSINNYIMSSRKTEH